MMLGLSVSVELIVASGAALLGAVAAVVLASLAAGYLIGRLFGLSHALALLVTCGNSICGNSAIAAVAPIIHADSKDIAASITFTAVIGVAVVLVLPFAFPLLRMTEPQYGILAGLTVYAVPQVLAATFPVGLLSTQIGTMVKLMRVLMLGPVLLIVALAGQGRTRSDGAPARPLPLARIVPWFVAGFVVLAGVRSLGWVPDVALAPIVQAAGLLTVVAMAALGLVVDVRALRRSGVKVTATAAAAVLLLGGLSLLLIDLFSDRLTATLGQGL
jgi:uncharacterized integral membrane protein (TIGR00698 family)